MMAMGSTRQRDTACTIRIEITEDNVFAHVELDDCAELRPGDRVRVHGAPIRPAFGDRLVLRRAATVVRAGWLERQWTRMTAALLITDLYEVSFTPRRML